VQDFRFMAAPSVRPLASGVDTTRDITSSGSRRFKFQQLLGHPLVEMARL